MRRFVHAEGDDKLLSDPWSERETIAHLGGCRMRASSLATWSWEPIGVVARASHDRVTCGRGMARSGRSQAVR